MAVCKIMSALVIFLVMLISSSSVDSASVTTSSDTRDCITSEDCGQNQVCNNLKCLDPCQLDVCGNNTICEVTNHVATCACETGFSGNAIDGCTLTDLTVGEVSKTSMLGKKKRYHFSTIVQMNWYLALAHCHSQGMHLASFDNQEEYEELVALIRETNAGPADVWLSGSDLGQFGIYLWMSTGRPVSYANWNSGEPNHVQHKNREIEHCLELSYGVDYKMNDAPCSAQKFVACEREATSTE